MDDTKPFLAVQALIENKFSISPNFTLVFLVLIILPCTTIKFDEQEVISLLLDLRKVLRGSLGVENVSIKLSYMMFVKTSEV